MLIYLDKSKDYAIIEFLLYIFSLGSLKRIYVFLVC
jgi:hypothetical protein